MKITVTELCPYCMNEAEVEIEKGEMSSICPHCGQHLLLCSLCDNDIVDCSKCPFERKVKQ